MSLNPGTRLGQYEVAAKIGRGGMGEVYRARDTTLGRDVAVKVLPDAFARDPERLARFEREAKTLAALNHPNIAQIYGFEKSAGIHALVLELVEGSTLAERIAGTSGGPEGPPLRRTGEQVRRDRRGGPSGPPMSIDEALPIARQMAEALEAAHEQGIVHRDLKPANVMVRVDGVVKVLDFGLAKLNAPNASNGPNDPNASQAPTITSPALLTGAGVILGTAAYMSPEQAKGRDADRRSDIWAFGCVVYEMLTGRRAFPGDDLSETLAAVIKSEPDWAALPPGTPSSIHRMLRRCLNKDRKARLGDASSLRIEIDDAPSRPDADPPAARGFRRERLAWAAGVALLGLAFALALAVAVRPARGEPEVRFDITVPPDTAPNPLAISPDGRRIAFVAGADGRSSVWVHTLDGRAARPLEGTDGAQQSVFWSPDSGSVGFFAERKLKRIDVESGAVQTLADAPRGVGSAWNGGGVILFAPTRGPLFRVSQAGGAVAVVTRVEGPEVRHVSPQFLPDGRHFLFFSAGDPDVQGVYVADLDGAASPRRVLADADAAAVYAGSGHLLFPRQGALMAQRFDADRMTLSGEPWQVAESIRVDTTQGLTMLSASDAGSLVYRGGDVEALQRRLVWFDRSGKEVQRLDDRDPVNTSHMALSPDGRRLAVRRESIWTLDTARGLLSRFTSGPEDLYPLWSPDGDRLVFTSSREGGRLNLYQRALTGGEDELLFATSGSKAAHDWSPDGRLLLYRDVDPRTGFDLWVLPVEREGAATGPAIAGSAVIPADSRGVSGRLRPARGEKPMPIAQTPAAEMNGQFSPDGAWIAYQSDESGRFEIYVQPFGRPGVRQRMSIDGGTQARWRRDGMELYYIAPDGRLMAVPIRPSSGSLSTDAGVPVSLFSVRVTAGTEIGAYQYFVSSDGQRFLVNTITDSSPGVISAIVNWAPPR